MLILYCYNILAMTMGLVCEIGISFSLARGAVGLKNLMIMSLALVTFSLARVHFHWLLAPGQLLRSQTASLRLMLNIFK